MAEHVRAEHWETQAGNEPPKHTVQRHNRDPATVYISVGWKSKGWVYMHQRAGEISAALQSLMGPCSTTGAPLWPIRSAAIVLDPSDSPMERIS